MIEEFGVIETLKSKIEQFTQTEMRIVTFVLDTPSDVTTMTIHDLADKTDTSSAAVSRLFKKIGFESFQSFKIRLSNELGSLQYRNPESALLASEPQELKQILLETSTNAIEDTLRHVDFEMVEKAVELINQSSVIFVFGLGFSSLAADNIFQKWTRVGKTVLMIQEESIGKVMLSQLHQNALFWGVSNSGNSVQVIALVEHAKTLNVPTMIMTRHAPSQLAELADFPLYTAHLSKKPSVISNSLYAQFSLIDLVFAMYINKIESDEDLVNKY